MNQSELREKIAKLIYDDAWYHGHSIHPEDFNKVTDRILALFLEPTVPKEAELTDEESFEALNGVKWADCIKMGFAPINNKPYIYSSQKLLTDAATLKACQFKDAECQAKINEAVEAEMERLHNSYIALRNDCMMELRDAKGQLALAKQQIELCEAYIVDWQARKDGK